MEIFLQEYGIYLGASLVGLIGLFSGLCLYRKHQAKRQVASTMTLGLGKTHDQLKVRLGELIRLSRDIDEGVYAHLEEVLLGADVGVKTTQKLLRYLREDVTASGRKDIHLLKGYLRTEILKILNAHPTESLLPKKPHVQMIVGVNGVGKTTTIGKLASLYRNNDETVLLAAADTFRAGAVDQLKVWATRVGANTLAQKEGADPAAVAYDAVKAGVARDFDKVVIDTAGRLHTKVNLMEELKKVRRVIDKALPGAPHEIILVVDATQGQNALHQAREFHQALGLTGIILTKLDGTAKGGIVVGILDEIGVPIRYVGLGERLEDLQPFFATEFVDALLA
ncbi:MAG: signal recognition particle-docking protein FtsY [Deltaproteobacteria bacterium]|nr:signal recognition particle-docking protein FtsY [Deltaproteobacteria bacterium]